jgi:three-Cys-motif partner protein
LGQQCDGQGQNVREWQYWTRNKLEILAGYLPAFNIAAKRSAERLYIDLMAGEPVNREKTTGEEFDGSARVALSASPPFTRLVFCEMPGKAEILRADLRQRFPGRRFRVYPGDCNETIDQVLADLARWRWAPTFVFADQQAAEIRWDTLTKVAAFKSGPRKAELWILMSPAMITKGVAGTNGLAFAGRVDMLYGTTDWRRIQAARDHGLILAEDYRDEMVNLLRWRIERELGYQLTARVPMRMPSGMPIYDMLFATDHPLGDKIMTHLYQRAAEREPRMRQDAKAHSLRQRDEKAGTLGLFELDPSMIPVESLAWERTSSWDPASRPWWRSGLLRSRGRHLVPYFAVELAA